MHDDFCGLVAKPAPKVSRVNGSGPSVAREHKELTRWRIDPLVRRKNFFRPPPGRGNEVKRSALGLGVWGASAPPCYRSECWV